MKILDCRLDGERLVFIIECPGGAPVGVCIEWDEQSWDVVYPILGPDVEDDFWVAVAGYLLAQKGKPVHEGVMTLTELRDRLAGVYRPTVWEHLLGVLGV